MWPQEKTKDDKEWKWDNSTMAWTTSDNDQLNRPLVRHLKYKQYIRTNIVLDSIFYNKKYLYVLDIQQPWSMGKNFVYFINGTKFRWYMF